MTKAELEKYRGCEGLPVDWRRWKKVIPYQPGEIDYEQPAVEMIRLTSETAEYAYGEYSPKRTRYEAGSRPKLERIADLALGKARTDREKAVTLLDWTWRMVTHCWRVRPERVVVGGTEEDILERGFAYCNELSRLFVTLCQVGGVPARMTFHWPMDEGFGHSCAEAYFDGKWQLCDATFNIHGSSLGGMKASVWDLMTKKKVRAAFDREVAPRRVLLGMGMPKEQARYTRWFDVAGVCNYPIERHPYKLHRCG